MGIFDDAKKALSKKSTKTVTIADQHGDHESAIPQMVITSAEGESEELTLETDDAAIQQDDHVINETVQASPPPILVISDEDDSQIVNQNEDELAKQSVDQSDVQIPRQTSDLPAVISPQNGDLCDEANSPQSAVQSPVVVEPEATQISDESAIMKPESIYEVIEPRPEISENGLPVQSEVEVASPSPESSKAAKESEGLLARSRAFWKQESKIHFSFPKFKSPFGAKHPKEESKSPKKEEKVIAQEYSVEAAEMAQDAFVVPEHYRKLDEDAAVTQKESLDGSQAKNEPVTETPESPKEVHVRSEMIHPKRAEEDFELGPETQATLDANKRHSNSPETLYGTCCLRLATLLRHKAFEIAMEGGKPLPPKKPPKPTLQAVAKARAEMAAKHCKDFNKPHCFGDNLPAGLDGIRYADEDTESSTDYRDFDNYGIALNPECYGIIQKFKEEELNGFRAPSTCSGMTSYYTADTITLKEENSSDNTLETVSLDSSGSVVYRTPTATIEPAISKKKSESRTKGSLPVTALKTSSRIKKVPPPIPPKPNILPKTPLKTDKKSSLPPRNLQEENTTINSLSLSPRPIRSTVRTNSIKKRPLTIAGVKATEFKQHEISRSQSPITRKPVFNTVVKNSSLKKMHNLPAKPCNINRSSSFTPRSKSADEAEKKPVKPQPPPRPPPPTRVSSVSSPEVPKPLPPEKVDRPPRKSAHRDLQKPIPPAKPVIASPKPVAPPRPPPPASKFETDLSSTEVEMASTDFEKLNFSHDYANSQLSSESKVPLETSNAQMVREDELIEISLDVATTDGELQKIEHDESLNRIKADAPPSQADVQSPFVISPPIRKPKHPQAPPRLRRNRSHTVEVTSTREKIPEIRRRSQSLSDIDEKRIPSISSLASDKPDLKVLYTTVNKDPNRLKNNLRSPEIDGDQLSVSSESMSIRPLPPPPPPPRTKSRSSSRRSRSDERPPTSLSLISNCSTITKSESLPSEINGTDIRPPLRKKKSGKQQFFSLHREPKDEWQEEKKFYSLKLPSEMTPPPIKPERKVKHYPPVLFDENANVSETLTKLPPLPPSRPRVRSMEPEKTSFGKADDRVKVQRSNSEIKKSHSSWYDAEESIKESNGKLDSVIHEIEQWVAEEQPEVPPKTRTSSKFYVDVAQLTDPPEPLPRQEDKETSPLQLEYSERSVQTSLETLSVSRMSRSELSDDTDDLLDLAQTLQDELKTIIKRHKTAGEALRSSENSCSTSELSPSPERLSLPKKSDILIPRPRPPLESTTSSASELWQMSSSEESEDEHVNPHSTDLSEISRMKKLKKIFYVAQEIASSEQAFVDCLKLLNVDFRTFIDYTNNQKGVTVVPDDVLNQILNHLPQLLHLNENLLMELKHRINNWQTLSKISDVVVKMGPFLKLYSWYIQDFEATTSLLDESKKKFPLFSQAVKDFEATPRCKRLTLNHYMLKPVQRIPQYRLLLQEYLHHLPDDSPDYDDTVEALRIVSDVANHANESMRHGDNFQKLISIQSSIIGHKEIIKPGRVFIKEGELMKLSRKGMQPRWFVLLNDLLLYLTPVQQGLYRINHELTLTGMKVAIPLQQDYQNEFSIISVTRSFTLNAKSHDERQEWILALTKAIEENASKRSTFTAGRLQRKTDSTVSGSLEQSFVLGKAAPVWIPDSRVTMCQLCTSEFTVTFRRHHCRACGKVVCSICSSNRISLPYLGNRIARVCDECYSKLGQGSTACTESGETDSDNQQIAVKSHLRSDRHKKVKRQLPSVLKEVCANDIGSTISGHLYKRFNSSWKKSWHVIKDKVLYEFKASEDVAALRSIPLLGYGINTFTESVEGVDPSLFFEISHPGQAPTMFHAETPGSAERWIKELKKATVLE